LQLTFCEAQVVAFTTVTFCLKTYRLRENKPAPVFHGNGFFGTSGCRLWKATVDAILVGGEFSCNAG
jgi:hypothetical protein